MSVQGVGRTERGDLVAVLRERGGARTLAIGIGTHPAALIQAQKERRPWSRPPTHALLASLVEALGGRISGITIERAAGPQFAAFLDIRSDRGVLEVGCAPEDALALAAFVETPIWVQGDILSPRG